MRHFWQVLTMRLQSFFIALDMLRTHKLRAFLTMLGVIIGVMSVTIIVMISGAFQSYLDTEFKKAGADTIILFFDPGRSDRDSLGSIEGLTTEDAQYIKNRVSSVDIVSSTDQVPAQRVRYEDRDVDNPTIFAVDENFTALNRMDVIEGRHITEADVFSRANVAVIGTEIRDRLFPDKKAIGKYILMPGVTLQVIGVLEKMDVMGSSSGRQMLVPLTTAKDKWLGGKTVAFITLRPKKGLKVEDTMQAVWEAMMIRSNNKPIYRLDSRESIMKIFGGIVSVAGAILASIAALSLLVGGIGIMNIMLVSVTERTKEIGLRKAVGAPARAILSQFLVEAATLSLVGGLIGMGIAWMMGNLVTVLTATTSWPSPGGLSTPFPVSAALSSAAFSAFIGMVFGLYPAVAAAKMDPIVALRKE